MRRIVIREVNSDYYHTKLKTQRRGATHQREIIYTIIRAKVLIMRRKNRDAP